jgi:hypothetical protein
LIIYDINAIIKIQNFLKENNILILGYYIQNLFFFKKDFNIKKIDKKFIINNLKQRILKFYLCKSNFIINIKRILIKMLLLLKKRYGNN